MKKTLQFFFVLLFAVPAFSNSKKSSSIEWFKPEIGDALTTDKAQVVLSGRAVPGTEIRLTNDQVLLIDDKGEIQSMPLKEAFPNEVAIADNRGLFDVILNLPYKTAQLPFAVKTPDGESKVYQINVVVKEKIVQIANTKAEVVSPYAQKTWSVWGGLGVNYLKYDQDSDIPSSLTFKSTETPAVSAKVAHTLNKSWMLQGAYNYSPGKTSSSDQIHVSEGSYNWSFISANATYFKPSWKWKFGKYASQFGVQGGFQFHQVPFVKRSSTTDATQVSVVTNNVTMATVGGVYTIQFDRYWGFETFLRYQYPVSSGSLFKVKPEFAFDGSVGAIYKSTPQWRWGLFWYGQSQKYGFSDHEDTYSLANAGPKISGSQTLFFSNFEARVGYEFD